MTGSPFDGSPDTAVVTSSYVTIDRMPILCVSHEHDEEEGVTWQFHCGNGDYDAAKMQLVRLAAILKRDPAIVAVASLPVEHPGSEARG